MADDDGRMAPPGTALATVGAPQGAGGGLSGLMTGRGGGNKRRRTTSAGHAMSEAQEGKVTVFILCECVFPLRLYENTLELMEPISHSAAFSTEIRLVQRAGNTPQEQLKDFCC